MAKNAYEPLGSMGTDTPIAALSSRPRMLFDYFQQLFAQVTNPPLDAIREELVTSLSSTVGPEGNLLDPTPASCRQVVVPSPILSNSELAKLLYINEDGDQPGFKPFAVDGLYPVAEGGEGLRRALDDVRSRVSEAIEEGAKLIILSDRHSNEALAPIPSLLLVSAVHHHLIREKTRTQVGLVIECGDAREVHHMALLLGFGAGAINPYLAFETIDDMINEGFFPGLSKGQAIRNYIKACGKGVLKVMSKMGISTVASYTGAQVFEGIGLGHELVDEYFTGTASRLGGVGLDVLAEEVAARHRFAYLDRPEEAAHRSLWQGGEYQWRREGEYHLFNPETVFKLQHATRAKRYDVFKQYTTLVNNQSEQLATLRGPVQVQGRRSSAGADRRGRARRGDRQAVLDGRDVVRLDLEGSPREPRHRHEPHRREVEHRRGRRGRRPVRARSERRSPPLGGEAGRVRALRRHVGVPHERRRSPDQDGAGGQARRGRSASGSEGLPVDRPDPALHAGRRAHQPSAAPRHLFDRRPQAAHPRPEELQPAGACT